MLRGAFIRTSVHDLAVIIVSTNEAHWLEPCLRTVFERAGGARLDVVVADNESTDGTRDLVESRFPRARVISCPNRGFAHANNRAAMTCSARYILFLNPDTEIVGGTFGDIVTRLDARPDVGLVGVKQLLGDRTLTPTIRYFPSVTRTVCEALGSERWPLRPRWVGERDLDFSRYDADVDCDWTSGSFMLVRREALLGAGMLDERFFIYSEEPDLCLRLKRAGWRVQHLPAMTIIHHSGKAGVRPKMIAQDAYARLQYARKHFSRPRRAAYVSAVFAYHAIRATLPVGGGDHRAAKRAAGRRAMRTLVGLEPPPFGAPPKTAIAGDSS
jgi:GT2 family glycosyltransferase